MQVTLRKLTYYFNWHLSKNQMLRDSILLFVGYLIAHALNMLYQMVVSRRLPATEYALLAAFVGALLIVQYPLMMLTTALSRYSSLLSQAGRMGDVRRLLSRWLRRSLVAGILFVVIGVLVRHQISDMLHIGRTGPVIVAVLSIPAFLMLPIVLGVSQGTQHFGWNAGTTMAGSVARLALGSLLIWVFHPTSGWGLLAHGTGTGLNVLALTAGLYWILSRYETTAQPLPKLRFFLLQSGLVQIAYATLMTADVILVKLFIPQEQSFAYAATLGRLTVFLSSTIVIAMFPKVTTSGRITPEQLSVFKQSLRYTTICAIIAVSGCAIFPRLFLRILFGIHTPSRTLQLMTIAMACIMGVSALLNTCLQFLVAQKRFLSTSPVLLAAAGYLIASTFWHNETWHILLWTGLSNTMALFALLLTCFKVPAPPTTAVQEC